jgi:uncharacterized RmlC-like cupin family protein
MTQSDFLIRSMDDPDTSREALNEHVDVTTVGGVTIGRVTVTPGWKWSETMGAPSCEDTHNALFLVSGRIQIRMDDGTEAEVGPGDFFHLPGGHDSWTVGDEPAVFLDIKPSSH